MSDDVRAAQRQMSGSLWTLGHCVTSRGSWKPGGQRYVHSHTISMVAGQGYLPAPALLPQMLGPQRCSTKPQEATLPCPPASLTPSCPGSGTLAYHCDHTSQPVSLTTQALPAKSGPHPTSTPLVAGGASRRPSLGPGACRNTPSLK